MYNQRICSADDIINAARSWLGTRFLHQGRLKKTQTSRGGVDCLGLLIGIAKELQLVDHKGKALASYDNTSYPHTPDTTKLLGHLHHLLIPKPITKLKKADICLFNINGNPQHLAIITEAHLQTATMIHAYAQARKVIEHELDEHWRQSMVAAFQIGCMHK